MNNRRKPREKMRFREVSEKQEGESRTGAGRAGFRAPLSPSWGRSVSLSVSLSLTLGPSPAAPSSTQSHSPEKGQTRGREKRGLVTVLPPGALPLPASPPWLLHLLPWDLTQPPPGGAVHSRPLFKIGTPALLSADSGPFCICSAHLSFWTLSAWSTAAPQQIFLTPEPQPPTRIRHTVGAKWPRVQ